MEASDQYFLSHGAIQSRYKVGQFIQQLREDMESRVVYLGRKWSQNATGIEDLQSSRYCIRKGLLCGGRILRNIILLDSTRELRKPGFTKRKES